MKQIYPINSFLRSFMHFIWTQILNLRANTIFANIFKISKFSGTHFFGPKISFWLKFFRTQKSFRPKFFFDRNFFWTPNFSGHKISWDPKLFLTQNFFWDTILFLAHFFVPKFFGFQFSDSNFLRPNILSDPKFFWLNFFLDSKFFWTPNLFWPKNFFWHKMC